MLELEETLAITLSNPLMLYMTKPRFKETKKLVKSTANDCRQPPHMLIVTGRGPLIPIQLQLPIW